MNDQTNEPSTNVTGRAKSIEPIQAATPAVVKRKRWHFAGSIVLMSLGVIAVIVYLLQFGFGKQYEGLGAALCAVACGGFLVWHVIHLFAEQDTLEEQQFHLNRATVSSPQANSAGQATNLTTPPLESGQNFK
jgi:hypothetical protein